jgi:hypothetical protein
MGVTANSVSTLLSLVALAENRGGKDKDGEKSILSPLFFNEETHERFLPFVWDYVNSAPIDKSRASAHKVSLTEQWIKGGLAADPKTRAGKAKLQHMLECGLEYDTGLSISELGKREKMLLGLRTTLLQMNKGLQQLMVSM